MLHNGQIVRHKNIRQPVFFLQIHHQVQDLRLNGNVQRRNRLIADDKLRIQRQRAADADSLPAATVQLMRVAVLIALGKPDGIHNLADALVQLLLASADMIYLQRLADNFRDRLSRIQGRIRVLKHHLHIAPQLVQLRLFRV